MNTSMTTASVGTMGVKPVKTAKVASEAISDSPTTIDPAVISKRRDRLTGFGAVSSTATCPLNQLPSSPAFRLTGPSGYDPGVVFM